MTIESVCIEKILQYSAEISLALNFMALLTLVWVSSALSRIYTAAKEVKIPRAKGRNAA
jgi:hypothetical protein